ncbi:MAG: arginine--tRNA ligase, partial [Burkholderiales bacterium]
MLPSLKLAIIRSLEQAIKNVCGEVSANIVLERPKVAAHGDLATNVAMQLAKPLKRNPRELAQALVEALTQSAAAQDWLDRAELAGPGFINLYLQPAVKQQVVWVVLDQAGCFGTSQAAAGHRVMVEFVSANPTGPLHVGHGRQAALGDALCHLMAAQGWSVTREFYYNDAGVQIGNLAISVQARCRGL